MGTRPSRRTVRLEPDSHAAPERGRARTGRDVPARLNVEVVAQAGVRAPGLARWLMSVAPARARGAVTVALVPDRRVRALNRQYREQDQATDVLSFPADEPGVLGDVVIALGVASRQATAAGHPLPTELRVLALHGLLHLLGYDHEDDDGRMARVEARLRRKGGLREGLIERSR
jgi:probable rRNA maturation factor